MEDGIPEKYYGYAMKELDSDPNVDFLAKCIAQEGSTDAGRAKYISEKAKEFYEPERKLKEEEEERKRKLKEEEEEREERYKKWGGYHPPIGENYRLSSYNFRKL